MSSRSQRQLVLLGALAVTLAGLLWWLLAAPGAATPAPARPAPRAASRGGRKAPTATPLDLRLSRLESTPPTPDLTGRNPFRFRPAPPPPPPPPPATAGLAGAPAGLPGGIAAPMEPIVPPITLKFIGMLSSVSAGGKVAILSDGRFVFHGREGDVIEGRYRVVRIGEESVQMEYVDGRGRQTIRLSGS